MFTWGTQRDQQASNVPLIEDAKRRNEAIFRELGELKKQQKLLTDRYVEAERERDEKKKEYVRFPPPPSFLVRADALADGSSAC